MRFITPTARKLAKKLHGEEHAIKDNVNPKDHAEYDFYYMMAAGIYTKIAKKVDDSNVELFNKIVDLEDKFNKLTESMKEMSKQQKYIWQTVEEKKDD